MDCSIAFFTWKNPMLWFMFTLNIPNLHRLKLDFSLLPWLPKQPKNCKSLFHFMLCFVINITWILMFWFFSKHMFTNMNLNIKDKTKSLNRRRKIGPMYLWNYLIAFLIRHVLAKHVLFVYCLSTAASFSCQQNITVLNQNIMSWL